MNIQEYLNAKGPSLGKDLIGHFNINVLDLAKMIGQNKNIIKVSFAQRYLRIDQNSPSLGRATPSFLREFITYTCFGLDQDEVYKKANQLKQSHIDISLEKRILALELVTTIHNEFKHHLNDFGALIAGDVVYGMSHREKRRESSTNILVRGSDIDLVFLIDDDDLYLKNQIEDRILYFKYIWLKHPRIQEELDFIVKTPTDIKNQLNMRSVKDIIAAKVLYESQMLMQQKNIVDRVQDIMDSSNAKELLSEIEERSNKEREELDYKIYNGHISSTDDIDTSIFFSTELDEFGNLSTKKTSHSLQETQK